MANKKPTTTKPKAVKPATRKAPTPDATITPIPILVDHIYRGPHHGADGVSDLRVVSVGPGKDAQGKHHDECVTVEPTDPPHRQVVHAMDAFRLWVRLDVTKGYEKIPGKGKAGKS